MENKKAIGLLFTANIISGIAQGLSLLAIPWYFAATLNQTSIFAMSMVGVTIVSMFWQVYAGALIDRYSRKWLFVIGSLIMGAFLMGVGIWGTYSSFLPAALVIVVYGSNQLFFNVHYPALYAFAQEITPPEHYGKINSWIEIQGQFTRIVAGALGAILLAGTDEGSNIMGIPLHLSIPIAPWELWDILLLDAGTYFLAAIIISQIKYKPIAERKYVPEPLIARIKQGASFLKQNPLVFNFGFFSHILFAVVLVQITILLPVYVNEFLNKGADVFASGQAWYSIGALSSGLFLRHIFRNRLTVAATMINMIIASGVMLYLAFGQHIGLFFAATLFIGITNAGTRITRVTFLFNQIPNHLIGRCNSAFSILNTGFRGLLIGLFSLTYFSEAPTASMGYLVGALAILISVFAIYRTRKQLFPLSDRL
jgi:DHA3 family macrolide efflux protein-like MFS transporter